MSDRFKNKYRNDSTRLKNWDYGWNAPYFITICTQNREYFFGEVQDGMMVLNDIGHIVHSEWLKTFEMRPDMNLSMGEFVVMPNHFHAIIGIGPNEYNTQRDTQRGRDAMHCVPTTMHCVPTTTIDTNDANDTNENSKNKFGPQSKNLASIIRGFKIGVTKNARLINPGFAWQSRYHDHIIRNDESFYRISEYIINNPMKWSADKFR
ncbi:MAG: hypothetical protein IPL55_18265 [Saprospiraceae bacterium]|jgi:REP element-mobilizing transposase RayT|nr:hypothetical protein [Saprospiraceae bacterium]